MKPNRKLIISIIVSVLCLCTAFCGCKKKPSPVVPIDDAYINNQSLATFELLVQQENAQNASDIFLGYARQAGLTNAEISGVLSAFADSGENFNDLYLALSSNTLTTEITRSAFAALQCVCNAVGATVTGDVFYTVAKSLNAAFPLPQADCRKLSTVIFGFDFDTGNDISTALDSKDYSTLTEKQINTFADALAVSLQNLVDISSETLDAVALSIKEYLASDSTKAYIKENTKLGDENISLLLACLTAVTDCTKTRYPSIISYAVNFAKSLSLSYFTGYKWDTVEQTVYYGYKYDGWQSNVIDKKTYDEKSGGYDEYFVLNEVVSGYTKNGNFNVVPRTDVELAAKIIKLQTYYAAYAALDEAEKADIANYSDEMLTAVKKIPLLVGQLLGKELHLPEDKPTATFKQLEGSFEDIAKIDFSDGLQPAEKAAAETLQNTLYAFLRGYLPQVF